MPAPGFTFRSAAVQRGIACDSASQLGLTCPSAQLVVEPWVGGAIEGPCCPRMCNGPKAVERLEAHQPCGGFEVLRGRRLAYYFREGALRCEGPMTGERGRTLVMKSGDSASQWVEITIDWLWMWL